MKLDVSSDLPIRHLRRLEFLVGDFRGVETLYPPEREPVRFVAHLTGRWETCERFIRMDFYANIPGVCVETFHAMITYTPSRGSYRMWIYAASQEEPVHAPGDFDGEKLVFLSDPTAMMWGMQRIRFTLTPCADGFDLFSERWEPDGFVPYCEARFETIAAA